LPVMEGNAHIAPNLLIATWNCSTGK
jgi:hypothetical protein